MKTISLISLALIYTFVVLGFVNIFSTLLEIPIPPLYTSAIITITGFALGITSYYLSKLKTNVKNYIITAIFILISIVFFIPYLQLRLNALEESVIFLLRIGIFFGLSALPITIVYAFIKKQKDLLYTSIILIMFFICYIRILAGDFNFLTDNIMVLILFFVTYFCLIELLYKTFYFESAKDRIKINNDGNNTAVEHLNRVINRYHIHLLLFYISSFIFTYIIFVNNTSIKLLDIQTLSESNISSLNTTIILVILFLVSLFIIWFVEPIKRIKKEKEID